MEVTIHISNNNQSIKQLTEAHNSSIPSLIGALSRIKESTNNFLTELINTSDDKGEGGNGDADAVEDEDGDDEDEKPAGDEKQNKRKSSERRSRKRRKT